MPRRRIIVLGLAAAAVLPASVVCDRSPTGPASSRSGSIRAITFADWSAGGYATPIADAAMDDLAATGANSVAIVVTAYQSTAASSTIRADDPRTPLPTAVSHAVARASALGLDVAIKPHVDVDDGTWRAHIAPASPHDWFESYRAFILPWASDATALGVRQFIIGTELAETLAYESEWIETIRQVRAVFAGELVYAASWDEAERVPFWHSVDLVGVDFYFPVARRSQPGRLEILSEWQPWLDRLHRLHRQTQRPILLTEVGYRSIDGAGMDPSRVYSNASIDLAEQADLYWAALQAVADESWIAGVSWWDWPADGSGGPSDDGYSPHGKPAESELRAAWKD